MRTLGHVFHRGLLLAIAVLVTDLAAGESEAWNEALASASAAASRAYRAPDLSMPKALEQLDYDGYRKILFRPERALWLDQGRTRVEWTHRGSLHRDRLSVMLSATGGWRALPFDRADFEYLPELPAMDLPPTLGMAGFKLVTQLNQPGKFDELAVFQDASYFRILGRGHRYGASCRGLGLRTGRTYEEFPRFTRWWLTPVGADGVIHMAALMESQSVTGAYHFSLRPGEATSVDVQVRLFARNVEREVILAPITSMFLWDGNTGPRQDVRPEVHDSDGLLIAEDSGTRIWRPLINRPGTHEQTWSAPVTGFGLLQRDRNPEHYHDSEALYHLRPGIWIDRVGVWPRGQVWLHEHHSPHEGYDNVNVGYRLSEPLLPGTALDFRYRIRAVDDVRDARLATVSDWAVVHAPRAITARIAFTASGALAAPGLTTAKPPTVMVSSSVGPIPLTSVQATDQGWEVRLISQSDIPATCWTVQLLHDSVPVSEQWQCPWRP